MLPSDLNKFKDYLDSTITYDYEDMGKLLHILNDDKVRSQFYIIISKLEHCSSDKPLVEVKEYMTTEARYVEEKIVITSYYEDHVQHYLLGNCIQKLKSNMNSNVIVFCEKYRLPETKFHGNTSGAKISE